MKIGIPKGESLRQEVQKFRQDFDVILRNANSEFVILGVHDILYSKTKSALTPLHRLILASSPLQQIRGVKGSEIDTLIQEMKSLIQKNVLEVNLQNKMMELLSLVSKLNFDVKKELVIEKQTCGKNATNLGRIDVIVFAENLNTIYELKRNMVNTVAKNDSNRLLTSVTRAIEQINQYSISKVKPIGQQQVPESLMELKTFKKVIIIGRRMKTPEKYLGIIEIEKNDPNLKIYSWDGWIAELERIGS